jgi:hypothetical protein
MEERNSTYCKEVTERGNRYEGIVEGGPVEERRTAERKIERRNRERDNMEERY